MQKGPEAFRTISEAAEELGVPQHVLRFWETKFSFIRPMKRTGGRRFYRPQDIAMLQGVKSLLHHDGYTIRGVCLLYREQGIQRILGEKTAVQAQHGADQSQPLNVAQAVKIPDADWPEGLTAPVLVANHTEPHLREIWQFLTEAKAKLDSVLDPV